MTLKEFSEVFRRAAETEDSFKESRLSSDNTEDGKKLEPWQIAKKLLAEGDHVIADRALKIPSPFSGVKVNRTEKK